MKPEKTLLKFHSRQRRLKIKVCYSPADKTYIVYQNNFRSNFKKLSAAIYVFEDLVFRTFSNQLPLSEWVCEGEGRR
jgi:hypothetical protein